MNWLLIIDFFRFIFLLLILWSSSDDSKTPLSPRSRKKESGHSIKIVELSGKQTHPQMRKFQYSRLHWNSLVSQNNSVNSSKSQQNRKNYDKLIIFNT